MNKNQLGKDLERFKQKVLDEKTITAETEEKLLKEIEKVTHLASTAHKQELQHYQQIVKRIDAILHARSITKESQFLKSFAIGLRESNSSL